VITIKTVEATTGLHMLLDDDRIGTSARLFTQASKKYAAVDALNLS
jgi:hypothetical protein